MVSTKSNKKNKVYEYYTSVRAVKEGFKNCHVGSIPAGEMDNFILQQMEVLIKSPKIIAGLINEAKIVRPNVKDIQILNKLNSEETFISHLSSTTQRQLLLLLIKKLELTLIV